MPQLPRELVKARAERLRDGAAERRTRWLDGLVGSLQPVLMEREGTGHSDNFAPIRVESAGRGETGMVRVVSRAGAQLEAAWA